MLRLPRLLTLRHVRAAQPMRWMKKALSTRHKMLRLPRKCKTPHCKVLRLPRENDTLALTRFQRIAPVTQNAKMTSHLVTRKHTQRKSSKTPPEALPHGSELTTPRRPPDDDTTNTTRTQVQPQTPTINGNPSLRIREKRVHHHWLPPAALGSLEMEFHSSSDENHSCNK